MQRGKKKFAAVILCFLMIIIPLSGQVVALEPETPTNAGLYTDNKLLEERLTEFLEEYVPYNSYFTSEPYEYNIAGDKTLPCECKSAIDDQNGWHATCGCFDDKLQCYGYAMYAQYILFGQTENGLVNPGSAGGEEIEYTIIENVGKDDIMHMPFGTHIRNENVHSIIMLESNEDGITYLDCNCFETWSCAVHLHQKSWDDFFTDTAIGSYEYCDYASYPTDETYRKLESISQEEGSVQEESGDQSFNSGGDELRMIYGPNGAQGKGHRKEKRVCEFEDISGSSAEEYIIEAYESNMVEGITDTLFGPEIQLSRYMMAEMLYKSNVRSGGGYSFRFVTSGSWIRPETVWASSKGILDISTPYHNAELITGNYLLACLYVIKNDETTHVDQFLEISDNEEKVMEWASENALIDATEDENRASLGEPVTRELAVGIIMRARNI